MRRSVRGLAWICPGFVKCISHLDNNSIYFHGITDFSVNFPKVIQGTGGGRHALSINNPYAVNTQGCYQSISIIASRFFEDGQIFTGFKSEGDGSFRFRRLTSSMAPRCAVSSSASPDGTIGHATLTPQGDHSRTQLVLTPQSLNSWGSPLPLLDIIFWAAASSHVLCFPVTL